MTEVSSPARPAASPVRWLVPLGIGLIVVAAYAPSLRYPYVQDAYHAVKINPVVERGDLHEIFTSDYWKDTISLARTLYRPVTVASFAFERRLAGPSSPLVSHAVNMLLHALTAWLLCALALRAGAGRLAASAAALLFAAHPLALQAVVNVVARADILATGLGLAALWMLSRAGPWPGGADPSPPAQRAWAWGSGAAVFLALGSKEVAVAVPPLLVLLELGCRGSRGGRQRWLAAVGRLAPSALAVLFYLHLRTLAIGEFPGVQVVTPEDNVLVGLHGVSRVATVLAMAGRYAGLWFWPVGLSPDYSGHAFPAQSSLLAPLPLAGALVGLIIAVLACAPWLGRGEAARRRTLGLGSWLVAVPYLVVGNVVVLNAAGFAERLIYFSTTGACLLAGATLAVVPRVLPGAAARPARVLLSLALAVAVVAGVVQTRREAVMWSSNAAFFEHTLRVAPRSLRAQIALAGAADGAGRLDEALQRYRRITETYPDYGGAWLACGVLLAQRGELAEAERMLRRAIEVRPEVGETHMNLGLVLVRAGRWPEAERALRRALLLQPGLVKAAAQLAHLLFDTGRFGEAAHFYRGCVELGRSDLRQRLQEAEARARGL